LRKSAGAKKKKGQSSPKGLNRFVDDAMGIRKMPNPWSGEIWEVVFRRIIPWRDGASETHRRAIPGHDVVECTAGGKKKWSIDLADGRYRMGQRKTSD